MNTLLNKINIHLNTVLFMYNNWYTQISETCLLLHIGDYDHGTKLYKIILNKKERDIQ